MKLYHWKLGVVDAFVVSESLEAARLVLEKHLEACRWQNPTKFAGMLADLQRLPLFVAEPNYPVVVGF